MGAGDGVCLVVLVDFEGTEVIVGHVVAGPPDLDLVDALARLQLAAHRRGCRIRLRHPCAAVSGLLDLVGLAPLFGAPPRRLPVEPRREAESGEELGIEEVVPPRDPVTRHFDHLEGERFE